MNELKPEDVMRALECLSKPNSSPDDRQKCFFMWKEPSCFNCYHEVAKNALALLREKDALIAKHEAYIDTLNDDKATLVAQIEKKDAEIERLTVNMNAYGLTAKNLAKEFEDYRADVQMEIADARAEAITEFAERMKKPITPLVNISTKERLDTLMLVLGFIDQIAEKMKGEENGESDL